MNYMILFPWISMVIKRWVRHQWVEKKNPTLPPIHKKTSAKEDFRIDHRMSAIEYEQSGVKYHKNYYRMLWKQNDAEVPPRALLETTDSTVGIYLCRLDWFQNSDRTALITLVAWRLDRPIDCCELERRLDRLQRSGEKDDGCRPKQLLDKLTRKRRHGNHLCLEIYQFRRRH